MTFLRITGITSGTCLMLAAGAVELTGCTQSNPAVGIEVPLEAGVVFLDGGTACGQGTTKTEAGQCLLLDSDPANCGAIGHACKGSDVCSAGVCSPFCGAGEALCGMNCTDLAADQQNCGHCGARCAPGFACTSGLCEAACPSGQQSCPGASVTYTLGEAGTATGLGYCADFGSDNQNCGGCASNCGAYGACVGGTCHEVVTFPSASSVLAGDQYLYCSSIDGSTYAEAFPPNTLTLGQCPSFTDGMGSWNDNAQPGADNALTLSSVAIPGSPTISHVELDFYVNDQTQDALCLDSNYVSPTTMGPLTFNVSVNGTVIGTFSFTLGQNDGFTDLVHHIQATYDLTAGDAGGPISAVKGAYTFQFAPTQQLEYTATAICQGYYSYGGTYSNGDGYMFNQGGKLKFW